MIGLARLHDRLIYQRRVRVLAALLARLAPQDSNILDVGCGDGFIDRLIGEQRPDVTLHGVDVMLRRETHIPTTVFDGVAIPYEDNRFDVVMFVDVLHHTADPEALLREARRVARKAVLIKDHTRDGLMAGPTLRFMDWAGNASHGVALPYNYWNEQQWRESFERVGLTPSVWRNRFELYPPGASWIFGRSLHFIARLDIV